MTMKVDTRHKKKSKRVGMSVALDRDLLEAFEEKRDMRLMKQRPMRKRAGRIE